MMNIEVIIVGGTQRVIRGGCWRKRVLTTYFSNAVSVWGRILQANTVEADLGATVLANDTTCIEAVIQRTEH